MGAHLGGSQSKSIEKSTLIKKIRYFDLVPMTEVRETKWGFKNVMLGDGEPALIEIIPPQE